MQFTTTVLLALLPFITASPVFPRKIPTDAPAITSHSAFISKDGYRAALSSISPPILSPDSTKLYLDCTSAILSFPPGHPKNTISLTLSHKFSLTLPEGFTVGFGKVSYNAWIGLTAFGLNFRPLKLTSTRNSGEAREFFGQGYEGPTLGGWGDVTFWPISEEIDVREPGLIEGLERKTCKAVEPRVLGRRALKKREVETELSFEWTIGRVEGVAFDGNEEGWFEIEKDAKGKGVCVVEMLWGKCSEEP